MHDVTLGPLFQQVINPIIFAVLTGVAGWVAARANGWLASHAKFLDTQTDATLAAGFNRALSNGIAIFMNSLGAYEGAHDDVQVKSWLASKAAQYAINHSPGFMAKFTGMTSADAAQKALAYLPPIKLTGDSRVATYVFPPTPKGITPEQEIAETDDLNARSLAQAKP